MSQYGSTPSDSVPDEAEELRSDPTTKRFSGVVFSRLRSGIVEAPAIHRRLIGYTLTFATSLATFGFFAIQGIILARYLGPAGRGVFAAAVVFPQALLYVGLLGAAELMAGYAARGLPDTPLRRTAAQYGLLAGAISMMVCVLLNIVCIPQEMRFVLPLAMLCSITLPLQQIRLSVQAVDHGGRRFDRYNAVRLIAAAAFPCLLLIAIGVAAVSGRTDLLVDVASPPGQLPNGMEAGRNSVSMSSVSSPVLLACLLLLVAHAATLLLVQVGMRESWLGKGAMPIGQAFRDGRGLMGAWLTTELMERLDMVLVLVLLANRETLGFYMTAIPIAALLIILPNTAALYLFNRGARDEERMGLREAGMLIGLGIVVQVGCAVSLAVALPWLVPAVYGADFAPVVQFAWLLLPAGVFRGLLQAAESYLRARKKPEVGIMARALGIPVLLGCSFLGAPIYGAAAIAAGLSLAQGVCFVVVAYHVLKDSRQMGSVH